MFTSKELEELSKQGNIKKCDFLIIIDILKQNGYMFKKKNKSLDNCTILESFLIGKGSESYVFLGENIENRKEVAVKIQKYNEEVYKYMIDNFQNIYKINNNSFIQQVYSHFFLEEQQICIQIVELCQKSLKDEINEMKTKETKFSDDKLMKIFLFAINALCEIHSNDIVHCNLKSSNILFSKDGEYKLADFGMFKNVKLHNTQNLQMGQETVFYLSPEQHENNKSIENGKEIQKLRYSTDIYSMGITLIEVLGIIMNMKVYNDLQSCNYIEIRKQIDCNKQNFYAFVENFMIQQEEKQRYFALRLRLQFINYFENVFPFSDEQNRLNHQIKIFENNQNNKNNKTLAYLYFYLSQTQLRSQDSSLIEKSLQIFCNLNLFQVFDASIFYEHYSQILNNSYKYEEANKYLLQSYQIKILLLEDIHLEIAHNLLLQSSCQKYLGNFQKKLDLSQKSLKILEMIFEKKDNPDLAYSLNVVGAAYKNLGDLQKSFKYFLKALQMYENLFSENHPGIIKFLSKVGRSYCTLGNQQKGLEYQLKALQMSEKHFSGNHPDIIQSLNYVGLAYRQIGDAQKGLEHFIKALQMCEKLFLGNHHDIAWCLNNIGLAYRSIGDSQKELEYFLKALQMREKLFSGNNNLIAKSLNNAAVAFSDLGDRQKGLEYSLKAHQIREKIFFGDNPELAKSFNNLGQLYCSLGDLQKGLKYLLRALQIREKSFPGYHNDIASTLRNIGQGYDNLDNLQIALEYYQKASSIFSVLLKTKEVQKIQKRVNQIKKII